MHILVLGSNGQLGQEFKYFIEHDAAIKNEKWEWTFFDRSHCDLSKPEEISSKIENLEFDWLINCAAYTQVDLAENHRALCSSVNRIAPGEFAKICLQKGARFIHYSTDYIFDGKKLTPYIETDLALPLNFYGKSKLEGEKKIIDSKCSYDIFRTSWVYGKFGKNFVKTIANKIQDPSNTDPLKVVIDQVGTPTSTSSLVDATIKLIKRRTSISRFLEQESQIFHFSQNGVLSWFDLANVIFFQIKGRFPKSSEIYPILTQDLKLPANRPNYSVLNKSKWENFIEQKVNYWQLDLEKYFQR